jgi:hypothetical protein
MNNIKVYIDKDDDIGEIVHIHNVIDNTYLSYLKNNRRITVECKSREEACKEIKRIMIRLREVD